MFIILLYGHMFSFMLREDLIKLLVKVFISLVRFLLKSLLYFIVIVILDSLLVYQDLFGLGEWDYFACCFVMDHFQDLGVLNSTFDNLVAF